MFTQLLIEAAMPFRAQGGPTQMPASLPFLTPMTLAHQAAHEVAMKDFEPKLRQITQQFHNSVVASLRGTNKQAPLIQSTSDSLTISAEQAKLIREKMDSQPTSISQVTDFLLTPVEETESILNKETVSVSPQTEEESSDALCEFSEAVSSAVEAYTASREMTDGSLLQFDSFSVQSHTSQAEETVSEDQSDVPISVGKPHSVNTSTGNESTPALRLDVHINYEEVANLFRCLQLALNGGLVAP